MTRYRVLLAFPLLWALAFLAADALLFGSPGYRLFLRTEVETVKVLTLVGSWAAALAFERTAYLRRAWFFIGGCMALLLTRDLTLAPFFEPLGPRNLEVLRAVLVVGANVSQVVGTAMLARAWRIADLSLPGSTKSQWAVVGAAVVLALVFAGPGVVTNVRRVAAGDLVSMSGVASALGDMVSLCLIAPLLLTALALRGGLIGWPWALLTSSYLAWLLYDAVLALGPYFGLDARGARTGSEVFRALGCTFGFSAGMAQVAVVRQMRQLGRS